MGKKGIALILSFVVIIILTISGVSIISRSVSEHSVNKRLIASSKAFWAAEAGLARMTAQLPDTTAVSDPSFGGDNDLNFTVPSPVLAEGFTNRWTVTSTGNYILSSSSGGTVSRTIIAVVEKPPGPTPTLITTAIETTGDLKISGSVTINPSTPITGSTLTFEGVFGMTKDQLKALADRTYTNPPANQQPVDGITWVELTGSNKYVISSNWSGSGLLIVNGNSEDVALDISGGWVFNGVIWVVGKLTISGTPTITGSVFAESDTDIENKLSGNATLNFSETDKDLAFGLVTQKLGSNILSWKEALNPYELSP